MVESGDAIIFNLSLTATPIVLVPRSRPTRICDVLRHSIKFVLLSIHEAYKLKIDKNTINKIARLSRIKLEDKESEDYIKDLNSILDWVEQLNEVNTDNIEPLSNISSSILPKRDDVSKDINSSDEILENAPDKLEGFFAVPKVVE